MKKTMFILVLALVMVAMSSSLAFAVYKVDTVVEDQNVIHGGYSTTTTACKACHDVHGGTTDAPENAYLFRWASAQAGCDYCHVGGSAATDHEVYSAGAGAGLAEHEIGAATLLDATDNDEINRDGIATLGCFDCHDAGPHGANETVALFNAVDAEVGVANGGALISEDWTSVTAYCAGCHDLNDSAVHATTTHPLDGTPDNVRAFAGSGDCTSCHIETAANGFPHQTDNGYAFLGAVAGTTAEVYNDGVCIACHVNGAGNAGVGETY